MIRQVGDVRCHRDPPVCEGVRGKEVLHPERRPKGVLGVKTPCELSADEAPRPVGGLPPLAWRTVAIAVAAGERRERRTVRRRYLRESAELGGDRVVLVPAVW